MDHSERIRRNPLSSLKIYLPVLLLLLASIGLQAQSWGGVKVPDRPSPPRLVNDLANVLPAAQERALEKKLVAYDDSTSTQVAIVTVPSLNGHPSFNYGMRIFDTWKIGQAKEDNGVLVLIAKNDRKMRIITGYGVEHKLTDLNSKRIIDEVMAPRFREGDFYGGINDATTMIMGIMSGEYTADDALARNDNGETAVLILFLMIFIFFFFIMPYLAKKGYIQTVPAGGYTYTEDGVDPFGGPVIIRRGSTFGHFSSGSGNFGGGGFGGFGGGMSGGGGAGGSW